MTVLTLLENGWTLESPEGYKIKGDPDNSYICLSTPYGNDGLRILGKDGIKESFQDYRYFLDQEDKQKE